MNGLWHVDFLEGGGTRFVADAHPVPDVGLSVLAAASRQPRVVKSRTVSPNLPAGLRPGARRRGPTSPASQGERTEGETSRNPFLQSVRDAQNRTSTVAGAVAARRARMAG